MKRTAVIDVHSIFEGGVFIKVKRRIVIIISVLAFVVISCLVADIVTYPLNCNFFDLIELDPKKITAIHISHYGKVLVVDDEAHIKNITNMFNTSLARKDSDYFNHTTGGDWFVRFLSEEGGSSGDIVLYPSSDGNMTQTDIKFGHYYYSFDTSLDVEDYIFSIWEETF